MTDRIETERLILRLMRRDDAEALLPLFGDPVFIASFEATPFDLDEMEAWVERNLVHQAANGVGLYTVVLRSAGLVIGDCGLEWIDIDGEPVAELGYDIRRDHWGHGYATEAASAIRDHALHVLGLPRLVSLIQVGNAASMRVAEKIGMTNAGALNRYGNRYFRYELRRPDPAAGG